MMRVAVFLIALVLAVPVAAQQPMYVAVKATPDFGPADALAGSSGDTRALIPFAEDNMFVALFWPISRGRLFSLGELDENLEYNPFGLSRINFGPQPGREPIIGIGNVGYYVYRTWVRLDRRLLGRIYLATR